jgi:hypothetical protein
MSARAGKGNKGKVLSFSFHARVSAPRAEETLEQIRANLVVERTVDGFADVVEEGGCPEDPIPRRAAGELEDLERVEEGVPFRVVARGLTDAQIGRRSALAVRPNGVPKLLRSGTRSFAARPPFRELRAWPATHP